MSYMFGLCRSLQSIDLKFNTSNVKNMGSMFRECNELQRINLSSFNTSKVTDMSYMFCLCESLQSIDLSRFVVSSRCNVDGLLLLCIGLDRIKAIPNLTVTIKLPERDLDSSGLVDSSGNKSSLVDSSGNKYTFLPKNKKHSILLVRKKPGSFCTATFNPNGGKVSEKTRSISVGETYGTLPSASRSGYNFTGWYTAKNGGKKISATTKVSKKEKITLYAHWTVKTSIKKADIKVNACTYNGKRQKPAVVVKLGKKTLKENKDFTVKYSNNINAGNVAVVTIAGKGRYRDSTSKKFKISPLSIEKKAYIKLAKDSYTWDGKEKKPGVAVYAAITLPGSTVVTLQNKKDYTYKYKNNKEIGKASVIITGKGNYSGTKIISYKINKAEQPVKVTPGSITKLYTDKGKFYKISVSGKKEFAKVTYATTNAKIASVKNSNIMLNGEGVATITVKVAATKHYQAQNVSIKVNVLKRQNITTAVKNGAEIAYSTTVKSLGAKVPSGGGKLTYKSLDTSIVSVDSKGNLNFKKAKKLGKVTIQITAAKSSSYAPAIRKLTITTVEGTPSVSCVQQQERKIYDGAFNLGAKADQNATLVYSSSNSAIASVASDGTVTLKEWQENDIQREVQITVTTKSTTFYNAAKPVIVNLTVIKKKNLQQRIEDEKIKFPDGKFWNHVVKSYSDLADNLDSSEDPERFQDTVSGVPCKHHPTQSGIDPIPGNGEYDCNKFDGAIECDGFARKVFCDIWEGQRVSGLQRIYDNNVQVGDYVRINNNGHSAIVTEVYSDSFKVIECNLEGGGRDYNCQLRHNWKYSKSSVTYRVHAENYSLN